MGELSAARKSVGYSREDLAHVLGMLGQQSQVWRWETGRVSIRPVAAIAVRQLLTIPTGVEASRIGGTRGRGDV